MRLIDVTLPTSEENLALDEALLDEAEDGGAPCESLRLWEPSSPMIVVGRSSRVETEVRESECRIRDIPILRRSSGGATIVTGPGCLMYAVVLSLEIRPALRAIDLAHRFVLETIVSALAGAGLSVAHRGTSDLTLGDRKFSGNSLRIRREHLLYHGTFLYDFPLELISMCLERPPREPGYRSGRAHEAFVTNLPLPGSELRRRLTEAWQVEDISDDLPEKRVVELVATKYSRREWNYRR
ncbi:MAG TPA: lipoate--protein ligase family protein [Pirellulales bacterium]|nr:lipoate--protein ligase family protein [Pirellulales bacterium]